jgi:hypothetical protein
MCYTIGPSSAIISYSKQKKPHVSILGPQWSEIVTEKQNILYSNFKFSFRLILSLPPPPLSLRMTLAGFEQDLNSRPKYYELSQGTLTKGEGLVLLTS